MAQHNDIRHAVPMHSTGIRMPTFIAGLDRDKHGRPIPWFVLRDADGTPDHRVAAQNPAVAYSKKICWLCGLPLGKEAAFVMGPMSVINRCAPEPPSHRECATYAAKACPFLSHPEMRRRPTGIDEYMDHVPGLPKLHNPGVIAVWFAKPGNWRLTPDPQGRPMFGMTGRLTDIGASAFRWFREGRPASRDEAHRALTVAVEQVRQAAEELGEDVRPLDGDYQMALRWLPR